MFRTLQHLAALCIALAVAGPARAELMKIYEDDFSADTGWQALYSSTGDGLTAWYLPLADRGAYRAFGGIGWRDRNHLHTATPSVEAPGIGEVNIWATQTAAIAGLTNADLRGGKLRLRVRAHNGLRIHPSARIGFWMQGYDPQIGKWVNYFNRTEITKALGFDARAGGHQITSSTSDWTWIEIPLSRRNQDWDCLGRRPDKVHYSCSKSVETILQGGNLYNFGIITLMTDNAGPIAHHGGEFHIDHIEIWVDATAQPQLTD